MAFIRNREEERTGYQNSAPLSDRIDTQCDFVMVYGMNETTAERIRMYREKGYVIHLMVGISWGHYKDYLYGDYDGENHWDEAQTDRYGNRILHGPDVPYMVPTISFVNYIANKLKAAVDLGVEAIHVEEPEFWDRAGYSEAFKREYQLYYGEKWTPPHESVDARFKSSRLKQYLYTRAIDRVSAELKIYALKKYGKILRFYVPTHSILNYTQWKIVSPEGKLADIPGVDGCIAQVWTGTSREKNWFNGIYKERTFETAYLEYGVMQELVKNTGRKMWFLHDPIEDNPGFDWNDYRKNYLCTVAASLLHPQINSFEVCPWPTRVFYEKYPRNSAHAITIPGEYATLLNNTFQTLGTLEDACSGAKKIGVLMGDAQLYQRDYPDSLFSAPPEEAVGTVLVAGDDFISQVKDKVVNADVPDEETLLKYMASATFPAFYGLALPLLKYGAQVRPVLLDNVRRYAGYLDDYDVLVMSYEYLKPDSPDMNTAIAEWVKRGGTLVYIGDGKDPYHKINSWWTGKYENAAVHLFEMLGIIPAKEKEIFRCGKGKVAVWNINPCVFGYGKDNADKFRGFFKQAVPEIEFRNFLRLRRNEYVIAAVMDESINDEPLTLPGTYADMFAPDFQIVKDPVLYPGENGMYCDISYLHDTVCVIGTSLRILSLKTVTNKIFIRASGAAEFTANIRVKIPAAVVNAKIDGEDCVYAYNETGGTVLVTFESKIGEREIVITTEAPVC